MCCCIWSTARLRIPPKPIASCAASWKSYGQGLADKPEIVALSKADALTPEAIKTQTAKLKKACKKTPLVLSAHSGQGVQEALRALRKIIDEARESADAPNQKKRPGSRSPPPADPHSVRSRASGNPGRLTMNIC